MTWRTILERYRGSAYAMHVYRTARDAMRQRREQPVSSPYGFALVGNASMQTAEFEPELVNLVRQLLPDVDVFVDVGANVGFYSCLARAAGCSAIAIEPLRSNLDFLMRNLENNGWRDVEVFPVGVSGKPGLATLYGGGTGASLLVGWDGESPRYRRRTIPLSTLDVLLARRLAGRRLLVKVDVEGHELDVLDGATELLATAPAPIWLVEISFGEHFPGGENPRFRETFERFWAAGYEAHTADDARSLVSPADIERWQRQQSCDTSGNYLFTRPTILSTRAESPSDSDGSSRLSFSNRT